MASKARQAFDEQVKDIDRLLELHKQEGGDKKGRRYGLEVLNKSAVVLITAFWEAYCEDIAAEGLAHLVDHAPSSKDIPKELKKRVAKELKDDQNQIAIWDLADDSWRPLLKARLSALQEERNLKLNTPKAEQIDELFANAVGIETISKAWIVSSKTNAMKAREKLDGFVGLRGNIAHRGAHKASVKKADVIAYRDLVTTLAAKTGGAVNTHVKKITRKPLW